MQTKKLKRIYFEILLVAAGHFLYGACMKTTDVVIRNDGKGYYDYLPAVFIYHDLQFGFRNDVMPYAENNISHSIAYNGKTVNKYPCGLAVLWTPFFVITHEWLKSSYLVSHNGYSLPYHFAVYLAALFYLLAGLVYLRKLLLLYTDNVMLVRSVQLVLLFGTNIYSYVYYESSFTHAYSCSLIIMFFYAFLQWKNTSRNKYLFITASLLGIIFLVRPFNILVILFLPFFSGGIKPFFQLVQQTWSGSFKTFLWSAILFLVIALVQPIIWFIQAGTFFPWTYTEETFFFSQPALVQTLFGFKKGLFIYTPVLLISLAAIVVLFIQNKRATAISLAGALVLLHYFISSWQMWWYGGSFGLRPYVDFYGIFSVMAIIALVGIRKWIKMLALAFSLLCIALNLVQTYQYTHSILAPAEMDFQGYKDIFLKTDNRLGGMLTYRYNSREIMKYPVKKEFKTNVKDSLYLPGEWCQLASISFTQKDEEWINVNAIITLDCSNADKEILYCHVLDSAQQTVYYEQLPLVTASENKQHKQTIQYCIAYKSARNCSSTMSIGFTKLSAPRRVYEVYVKQYAEKPLCGR